MYACFINNNTTHSVSVPIPTRAVGNSTFYADADSIVPTFDQVAKTPVPPPHPAKHVHIDLNPTYGSSRPIQFDCICC